MNATARPVHTTTQAVGFEVVVRAGTDIGTGLYEGLLGEAVAQLAPAVRAVHVGSGPVQGHGSLEVHRRHFLAWVAARWFTLPPAGSVVPLHLTVVRAPHRETWTRRFGNRALVTEQFAGPQGELVERAGRWELRFSLRTEHGDLCFRPLGAVLHLGGFRIPVPRRLSPHVSGTAAASPDGGRLVVCFAVGAPLVGTILTYHVELEPSP